MDQKHYFIFVNSQKIIGTEKEVQCCLCDKVAYSTETGSEVEDITDKKLEGVLERKEQLPKMEFPKDAIVKYICNKCAEEITLHFAAVVARVLNFREKQNEKP